MSAVTRRSFFHQTTVGAAAVAVLATAPVVLGASRLSAIPFPDAAVPPLAGPLVAYLRDPAKGEVALFVGTREIVLQDHELVSRLLKAVR